MYRTVSYVFLALAIATPFVVVNTSGAAMAEWGAAEMLQAGTGVLAFGVGFVVWQWAADVLNRLDTLVENFE